MNKWRWAGVGLAMVMVLSSTSAQAQAQERKKKRGVSETEVRAAVTRYLSEVRPKALLPFLPLVDVQVSGITYMPSRDGDLLDWRVQGKVALKRREQKTVEAALLALLEAALVGRKQAVFSERYYSARVKATITIVPPEGRRPEKLPPVVGTKSGQPAPVVAAPVVVFVPVPVYVPQPSSADYTWWQPPASGTWYEPPAFGVWWLPPPSGTWWEMCPGAGY